MNKKKILVDMFVVALLTAVMFGCGNNGVNPSKPPTGNELPEDTIPNSERLTTVPFASARSLSNPQIENGAVSCEWSDYYGRIDLNSTERNAPTLLCEWVNFEDENSSCQWLNAGGIGTSWAVTIKNDDELRSHLNCTGGNYPDIDFSRHSLLLMGGNLGRPVISVEIISLERVSAGVCGMDIQIMPSDAAAAVSWRAALVVDASDEECDIELRDVIVFGEREDDYYCPDYEVVCWRRVPQRLFLHTDEELDLAEFDMIKDVVTGPWGCLNTTMTPYRGYWHAVTTRADKHSIEQAQEINYAAPVYMRELWMDDNLDCVFEYAQTNVVLLNNVKDTLVLEQIANEYRVDIVGRILRPSDPDISERVSLLFNKNSVGDALHVADMLRQAGYSAQPVFTTVRSWGSSCGVGPGIMCGPF